MKKLWAILFVMVLCLTLLPGALLTASADEIVASGSFKSGVTWELVKNGEQVVVNGTGYPAGTLTISGSGAMDDYDYDEDNDAQVAPWSAYRSQGDGGVIINRIEIGSGVTHIGKCAFYGCEYIESVTIPASVTSIGNGVFFNCKGLASVAIPTSVTSIGGSAFSGCTNLTSVTIPASVTSIGTSAFYDCTNLTSVAIPASVTSIGTTAFYGCTNLASVVIPASVTIIGRSVFSDCTKLASVVIPASVEEVERNAFSGCTSLRKIVYLGQSSPYMKDQRPEDNPLPDNSGLTIEVSKDYGSEYFLGKKVTQGDWLRIIVTFCANNGTEEEKSQAFKPDLPQQLIANTFTREGCTFTGWNTKADGSGTGYTNCQEVTLHSNNPQNDRIILYAYAQWKKNAPTGLAGAAPSEQGKHDGMITGINESMEYSSDGTSYTKCTGSEITGLAAGKYYVRYAAADGVQASDSTEVTVPEGPASYKVSFDANGGAGSMSDQTFTAGVAQKLTANAFTRAGYTFTGWNTAADGSGTDYADENEMTLTENIILYAQWEENASVSYKVSFNANGGAGSMSDQIFTAGVAQKLSTNAFTRAGYTFTGWNTAADGSGTDYADENEMTLTENIILYAQWKKNAPEAPTSCTVIFNANGGVGSMADQTFEPGKAQRLTLNSFYREGYYFTGWNTSANGTGTRYTNRQEITLDKSVTLYAQWEAIPEETYYTVTFDANGGEGSMYALSIIEGMEASLSANRFTREGYAFAGWNTQADGSGTGYGDGGSITLYGDVTLYAQWTKNGSGDQPGDQPGGDRPGTDGSIRISAQPQSAFVAAGKKAEFTVKAEGEELTYQWYIDRNDGEGWKKLKEANSDTYISSVVDPDCNGFRYYCEITDKHGNTVNTDTVVLYVSAASDVPETGDSATPVMWLVLSVVSAAGVWFMRRKGFVR